MPKPHIPKTYDPKAVESKWYGIWEERGYFNAEPNSDKPSYTIVIPPPNVTDRLHMGHAYNNTFQDVLIRFKRMQGFETLWMPGTDHAGIATQNVVERRLAREGQTRHDLGREAFVQRVWEWRREKGGIIIEQLKVLGCSCDWRRESFTMDDGLSRAVTEVFVRLHEKGLIYRGKYIINWCPRCTTALSDEEVVHREEQGRFYYVRYHIADSENFLTVATTRPETILGDTAVAFHPEDSRHSHLLGKSAIIPLVERNVPIITDSSVDPDLGTGLVKITPAHDPDDFLIGNRHDLPRVNILNDDATLNDNAGKYAGLDRFEAREAVLKDLEAAELIEKVEDRPHHIGHCYRCDTVIEPYISEQWFVKTKPLAEPALKAVSSGEITLYPPRWKKVYEHWMENIRDWCISRQLWWGHRIPVYYCGDCDAVMVLRESPGECTSCGGTSISQDPDVLDTWFSSWLWPFSTLGWPEKTPELEYFYPTQTLVTGHEILFFWVARMVMAGYEFIGAKPFERVYLHGIVRTAEGQKMSKSLGTGIDPLDMVKRFSADAVRYSLLAISSPGQDVRLSETSFEVGRNFSNKLWNAYRFLQLSAPVPSEPGPVYPDLSGAPSELADRWILSQYNRTVQSVTESLENLRFHDALDAASSFLWGEYCDWYLELIKPRLSNDDDDARNAAHIARYLMRGALKLLHPFIPFITEEVWQRLSHPDANSIMVSSWPEPDSTLIDQAAEDEMRLLQDVIVAVRTIRSEMSVPPSRRASLVISAPSDSGAISSDSAIALLKTHRGYIQQLCRVDQIEIGSGLPQPPSSASAVVRQLQIFVPLGGLIDLEFEKKRLEKEMTHFTNLLDSAERRLANDGFLKNAPPEVVDRERKKATDFSAGAERLHKLLTQLDSASPRSKPSPTSQVS